MEMVVKVQKSLGKRLSTSKRYEHELKVTTNTIQYSQGPWYSTVHNNHSNTSTHVQGGSERSELAPCNIYSYSGTHSLQGSDTCKTT